MFGKIKHALKILRNKEDKSLTRQAIENSIYSSTIGIVSKIGGLIFTILLARILMPELFGLYNLVLSIILTVFTFTDLGINTALSRYLSESLTKGKKGEVEARSRVRFLFNLKLFLTFGASLLLFLFASLISETIFKRPEMILPIYFGSIYIFLLSFQGFLGTFFYPLKKLKYNLCSEIIFQISKIILFIILIKLYLNMSTVFWVLIISTALSILFYLSILLAKQRRLFFGKIIPVETKRISIFLGWTMLLYILLPIYSYVNTFMLGLFVEDIFLGYFNAIISIVLPIAAFLNFGLVLLPIFTEISGERLTRGFKKIIKYLTLLAIPASIGLMFIIVSIVKVLYGMTYVPTSFEFAITLTGILLSFLVFEGAILGAYFSLFNSKEKVKFPTLFLLGMTLVNIILNYVFIKFALQYGSEWTLVAVSLATVISRYLNLGVLNIFSKKKFGLSIEFKDIIKPLIASLIMLGFLFLFNWIFNPGLWISLLMVVLAVGVYFIGLRLVNKVFNK